MLFFRPRLIDALKDYNRERLINDIFAGVTVGMIALPLAMAFAIASGLKPEAGIFTAIIAGGLISLLGGSRVQIGGPAGAFIVIVYGIFHRYGLPNLIIATVMSGIFLMMMGLLKIGNLVRFVPISVVIGFTNGIAVLIFLSQIKELLGLQISRMPADFFGILGAIGHSLNTINPAATLVAIFCIGIIIFWQFWLPKWKNNHLWISYLSKVPGTVTALIFATLMVAIFKLPIETIGTRFGGIPAVLPTFSWPSFSWETVQFLLIPALTLAFLGALESLLCARVADGLIKDRHDPNQELMAQGIANFITPFFGGMPATGTIARTITNIKNGATSPIAGIVHSVTLLMVILIAAPLAKNIPMSAMAAILIFVAWNMGEWREFSTLKKYRMPYRFTMLSVFFLTVIFDLTVAIQIGLIAACVTFIYRISNLSRCESVELTWPDQGTPQSGTKAYRLYGALFFGAVAIVDNIQNRLPNQVLILDFEHLLYMDSSGADAIKDLSRACLTQEVKLIVCGLSNQPLDIMHRIGLDNLIFESNTFPNLTAALSSQNTTERPAVK